MLLINGSISSDKSRLDRLLSTTCGAAGSIRIWQMKRLVIAAITLARFASPALAHIRPAIPSPAHCCVTDWGRCHCSIGSRCRKSLNLSPSSASSVWAKLRFFRRLRPGCPLRIGREIERGWLGGTKIRRKMIATTTTQAGGHPSQGAGLVRPIASDVDRLPAAAKVAYVQHLVQL